ncbi:MAG: hypothetical protein COA68_16940 [Oceanobacter sp.]|nr:MAG: hypothetical protein COA68_16940 [Oceanobacter sp.]
MLEIYHNREHDWFDLNTDEYFTIEKFNIENEIKSFHDKIDNLTDLVIQLSQKNKRKLIHIRVDFIIYSFYIENQSKLF